MTAEVAHGEKLARACKVAVFVRYFVIVVLSSECGYEAIESNAVFFLSVSFGLLYLTDHARVHIRSFAAA